MNTYIAEGIQWLLVISAICIPFVLFAGEPDLIDAIINSINKSCN